MTDLVRGQRAKLSDLTAATRLSIAVQIEGVRPEQVVCAALLLGDSQVAISSSALVSTEHPRSDCGGVVFRPDGREPTFELDLDRVTASASSVLVAVGFPGLAGGARNLHRGELRILVSGSLVARYPFSGRDFGEEGAIALGEVYRKSNVWRIRAAGEGFVGGMPAMLSRYKLTPTTVSGGPGGGGGLGGGGGGLGGGGRGGAVLQSGPVGVHIAKAWPGDKPPQVPKDLTRSVGLILTRTAEGKVHTGTGFIVTPGGHFITCNHVVDDAEQLSICIDGTRVLRPAEVIARDPQSDLAICWISDRNGSEDWLMLAGQGATPGLGDELGLLGFPLGVDLGLSVTYSQGIVNSLRSKGDVPVLQIDVGAAPGSSGGPVFRRSDGRVLGVLTSGISGADRGMHINFAVDLRAIWRLGWLA